MTMKTIAAYKGASLRPQGTLSESFSDSAYNEDLASRKAMQRNRCIQRTKSEILEERSCRGMGDPTHRLGKVNLFV